MICEKCKAIIPDPKMGQLWYLGKANFFLCPWCSTELGEGIQLQSDAAVIKYMADTELCSSEQMIDDCFSEDPEYLKKLRNVIGAKCLTTPIQ